MSIQSVECMIAHNANWNQRGEVRSVTNRRGAILYSDSFCEKPCRRLRYNEMIYTHEFVTPDLLIVWLGTYVFAFGRRIDFS